METCPSHKKIYLTKEIAEEALIEARTRYEYAHGQGPISVYKCDDCGYFHLTSKGIMNARLEQLQREGTLKLKKESDEWERRIKNRRRR
jgi:hypothetical protein